MRRGWARCQLIRDRLRAMPGRLIANCVPRLISHDCGEICLKRSAARGARGELWLGVGPLATCVCLLLRGDRLIYFGCGRERIIFLRWWANSARGRLERKPKDAGLKAAATNAWRCYYLEALAESAASSRRRDFSLAGSATGGWQVVSMQTRACGFSGS